MSKVIFKLGDRIRCVGHEGYLYNNKCGVIMEIHGLDELYVVCFDEAVGGWDDEELGIPEGRGIWLKASHIILVSQEVPTETDWRTERYDFYKKKGWL